MKSTQLLTVSASLRLLAAARALTASFISTCNHAAARLRPIPATMLTLSVLACSTASAQTAHLSQVQTVLNTPS
jgi:hypothetical protein